MSFDQPDFGAAHSSMNLDAGETEVYVGRNPSTGALIVLPAALPNARA